MELALPVIIFAIQTLLLVSVVLFYRTFKVFIGRTPANSWPRLPSAAAEPALVVRCHDAHKNCLEMLPVFLGVLWAMTLLDTQYAQDQMTLIFGFVGLRMAQSAIHVVGTAPILVMIRGVLFSGQLAILLWLSVNILSGILAA